MRGETYRRMLGNVGMALRDPEEFAVRWQRDDAGHSAAVWLALALTAAAGTFAYGMTMGMGQGVDAVFSKAQLLTLAAGLSWAIPLPALYILNSLTGSRLRLSVTLLAALVTTSWGGLALVASVPVNWFFTVAVPDLPVVSPAVAQRLLLAINGLIVLGVSVAMCDVFGRVMHRLEPGRQPIWFLVLVGTIGIQLCYLFGLFAF